jgi:hypothetical protein
MLGVLDEDVVTYPLPLFFGRFAKSGPIVWRFLASCTAARARAGGNSPQLNGHCLPIRFTPRPGTLRA